MYRDLWCTSCSICLLTHHHASKVLIRRSDLIYSIQKICLQILYPLCVCSLYLSSASSTLFSMRVTSHQCRLRALLHSSCCLSFITAIYRAEKELARCWRWRSLIAASAFSRIVYIYSLPARSLDMLNTIWPHRNK